MDIVEGLRRALQTDADALKASIQTERQWCLDAFVTVRPFLVAAVEDAQQALLDAPLPFKHHEIRYQDAVNALWFCDNRIQGLREGMTALATREMKEAEQ